MQQDMKIGYISFEVHKQVITENYKGTQYNSQSLAMKIQERVFFAIILPLIS